MSPEILIGAVALAVSILAFMTLAKRDAGLDKQEYQKRWERVQQLLNTPETIALSVIEADKLLDKALKESKFKGTTMGERMVSAKAVFTKRDDVWGAHKLRNKIVHESDIKVQRKSAKTAIVAFRRALIDLGAL